MTYQRKSDPCKCGGTGQIALPPNAEGKVYNTTCSCVPTGQTRRSARIRLDQVIEAADKEDKE